jgi:serine-type D-Ala-D-Ala carboxypeptidase/endopeptidase (penicillin-binding protein 4)
MQFATNGKNTKKKSRNYFKISLINSIITLTVFLGSQFPTKTILANSVKNSSSSVCSGNLKAEIDKIITRPEWARSRWGILIQTLDSKEILYSLDAQKYFIPASNVKLLTTAAALLQFGSQFRIRTSVYGTGKIPNLETLKIVGKGDPSLTTEHLKALAKQLKQKGIRQVSTLIVEDNYFQQAGINYSWEWEDLFFSYATSVNSLILNENAVTLTLFPQERDRTLKLEWSDPIAARQWQVENNTFTTARNTQSNLEIEGYFGNSSLNIEGELAENSAPDPWSLSIINPSQYFLETFLKVLIDEGIRIKRGKVITNPEKSSLETELAYIESEPLSVLIQKTNQESNNLFAEALLQILENKSNHQTGLEVLQEKLTQLGVNLDSYVLVDGSGLSRHNLVSPEAIVKTLQLIAQTNEAETYRASLAVAGENGTLEERFKDTLIEGNLQAKTGTLSGHSALSGYLNIPEYKPLVFSIIVNQSNQSATNLRRAIDEIVVTISQLSFCQKK